MRIVHEIKKFIIWWGHAQYVHFSLILWYVAKNVSYFVGIKPLLKKGSPEYVYGDINV